MNIESIEIISRNIFDYVKEIKEKFLYNIITRENALLVYNHLKSYPLTEKRDLDNPKNTEMYSIYEDKIDMLRTYIYYEKLSEEITEDEEKYLKKGISRCSDSINLYLEFLIEKNDPKALDIINNSLFFYPFKIHEDFIEKNKSLIKPKRYDWITGKLTTFPK